MTPLPSPGKVIRCNLQHTWAGNQNVATRFYISYSSSAPTAANLIAMATEIGNLWGTWFSGMANTLVTLETVTCQDLSSSTGAEGSNTGGEVGTRSGTAPTLSVSATVEYQIARRYRGGKPRGSWPFGVTSDIQNDATWTSTFISALDSAFGSFMAALLAYSGDSITKVNHVNVGYYQGVNPPVTLPSGRVKQSSKLLSTPNVDAVTTHSLRRTLGSQRRRLG